MESMRNRLWKWHNFFFSFQMEHVKVFAAFHLVCQTSSQYFCNSQYNCVSASLNACLPPEQ